MLSQLPSLSQSDLKDVTSRPRGDWLCATSHESETKNRISVGESTWAVISNDGDVVDAPWSNGWGRALGRGSRVCVGGRSWRLHGTLSQPPPSPALVIEHPLYNHGRPDSALSNPFCYNITILNTSNTDFVIEDLQLSNPSRRNCQKQTISIPKAQYGEVVSNSPSSLLCLVLFAPSSGDGSFVVASIHVLSCSTNASASFHRLQSSLVNQISFTT